MMRGCARRSVALVGRRSVATVSEKSVSVEARACGTPSSLALQQGCGATESKPGGVRASSTSAHGQAHAGAEDVVHSRPPLIATRATTARPSARRQRLRGVLADILRQDVAGPGGSQMSLSESQYPAPQLGAALEVHLSESDSSTLLFAGRSALRRASRAQICWWVATMGMYAGARPAACVCCRSCVGKRRSGPLVGPIGQPRKQMGGGRWGRLCFPPERAGQPNPLSRPSSAFRTLRVSADRSQRVQVCEHRCPPLNPQSSQPHSDCAVLEVDVVSGSNGGYIRKAGGW